MGLSTRAIAESAVRGGHRIVTLDYFGDRDQAALVENLSLKRALSLPFSAEGLLEASRQLDYQEVVYVSNLENHPDVVDELARGGALLGNPPEVLRRVRDWRTLRAFCRRSGLSFPTTLLQGEERRPILPGPGCSSRCGAEEGMASGVGPESRWTKTISCSASSRAGQPRLLSWPMAVAVW